MFWNRIQAKNVKTYEQIIMDGIERLEQGDKSFLHQVYCAFAFYNQDLIRRAGRAIRSLLETYTLQQMIELSERFRQYTSLEWSIDWRDISLQIWKDEFEEEKDYLYALIVGSFHPNGYFRERCLFLLAEYDNTLPYLLLRMNDWVGAIRDRVKQLVFEKIKLCPLSEIFLACQALTKVERSGRRQDSDLQEVRGLILRRIADGIHDFPVAELSRYEPGVRKEIYKILFSEKLLDMGQADELLKSEKNSFCQTIMITGILEHYDCSMETVDRYLSYKASGVRRKALDYKYQIVKNAWPGLERMLLDTSRGIRETAAFILVKYREMDIPAFYTQHLSDENPVVPITGLGETGNRDMVELITPFLYHPSERVVKSTILSIGRLAGAEEEGLYWNYLLDRRVSVSKASYISIKRNAIRFGAGRLYEEFQKSGLLHVKWYLALLLLNENSWDRLPYVIGLYQEESLDKLRGKLLESMWKRNVYARVSESKGEQIKSALEQNKEVLPENLVKEVLFDLQFVTNGK